MEEVKNRGRLHRRMFVKKGKFERLSRSGRVLGKVKGCEVEGW